MRRYYRLRAEAAWQVRSSSESIGVNILQRIVFDVTRKLLITVTGTGADRSRAMNNFHHKLSFRLHRKLGLFGLHGETRVALKILPGNTLRMRAEDGGVAHQFLVYGKYEPFESGIVKRLITTGSTVFNIGANIGYYTLIASISADETGNVVAFEPAEQNFQLLRKNISDNHLRNVEARNEAVSDSEGKLKLFLSESNSGDHQIYTSHDSRMAQEIDAITLDAFHEKSALSPEVLIIDVQGAELKVLRGFRKYLSLASRKPVAMLMEFGPRNLHEAGDSAEALLDFLSEMKLDFVVVDEAARRLRSMTREQLLASIEGPQEKNLLIFDASERTSLLERLAPA